MSLKKDYSIPFTQAKLSSALDFSGYIYPQFVTTSGFNLISAGTTLSGALNNQNNKFINQNKQSLLSSVLNYQSGSTLLAGIKRFDKNFSRDVYKRKQLGNYEYYQSIPGTIGITLTIEKVSFYETSGQLDKILDINYDGSIKQSAPLMIVENVETPSGDIKSIMYMDCWIKSSKITYQLESNILVVNNLSIEVTKMFAPIDTVTNLASLVFDKIGLIQNNLNFNFDIGNTL